MSKKFNLREFQTTLSQKLQAAASRDNTGSRLGFRVGDVNWLVSLSDTEEVIPVPLIAKIPGAQRWFRGVANIRGNLFAVSDFSDFMGQGVTPPHANCRLLIPHHDYGVNSALLIHGTLGLRNVTNFEVQHNEGMQPWISRHFVDAEGTGWCDMNFGQLLGNADFMKVEARIGN